MKPPAVTKKRRAGDHVRLGGATGYVEFVVDSEDPESEWYFENFGCGCMIVAEQYGHVFLAQAGEDLVFVERAPK